MSDFLRRQIYDDNDDDDGDDDYYDDDDGDLHRCWRAIDIESPSFFGMNQTDNQNCYYYY